MRHLLNLSFALFLTFAVTALAADNSAPRAPTGDAKEPAFSDYLETFKDPLSGYAVTRITGTKGEPIPNTEAKWQGRTRSIYSLKQVWSADEKLLYLGIGGPLVLDGGSYTVLHAWGPPKPGTWHPTTPDEMVYVDVDSVLAWNARKNSSRVLATIEGYTDFVQSESEDWISADGKLVGVTAKRKKDGKDVGFLIDIENGRKATPDFVYADLGFARVERQHQVCRPSLSGKFVVVRARGGDTDRNTRGEAFTVFDLGGKEVGKHWSPPHTPGHGDLALAADGSDLMVGRSDDGWADRPDYFGSVSWGFKDGKLRALGPAGSHTSGRAIKRPGWAFAGNFGKGSTIFMFRLDGSGDVRVICQTWHRDPVDYWAQTQPVPSPTGTRVLFATNWGVSSDGAKVGDAHSFVVEIQEE